MKTNLLRKAIGYTMRTERLIKRKTLQQVADHLGISKNQVSYYETGKTPITVESLNAYCEFIGINMIHLLNKVEHHEDYLSD